VADIAFEWRGFTNVHAVLEGSRRRLDRLIGGHDFDAVHRDPEPAGLLPRRLPKPKILGGSKRRRVPSIDGSFLFDVRMPHCHYLR